MNGKATLKEHFLDVPGFLLLWFGSSECIQLTTVWKHCPVFLDCFYADVHEGTMSPLAFLSLLVFCFEVTSGLEKGCNSCSESFCLLAVWAHSLSFSLSPFLFLTLSPFPLSQ